MAKGGGFAPLFCFNGACPGTGRLITGRARARPSPPSWYGPTLFGSLRARSSTSPAAPDATPFSWPGAGIRWCFWKKATRPSARCAVKRFRKGFGSRPCRPTWRPTPPGFPGALSPARCLLTFATAPFYRRRPSGFAPGGLFLLEGFTEVEAARRGRPKSPHYWKRGELFSPPEGLALVAAGEGVRGGKHRAWAVWRKL